MYSHSLFHAHIISHPVFYNEVLEGLSTSCLSAVPSIFQTHNLLSQFHKSSNVFSLSIQIKAKRIVALKDPLPSGFTLPFRVISPAILPFVFCHTQLLIFPWTFPLPCPCSDWSSHPKSLTLKECNSSFNPQLKSQM